MRHLIPYCFPGMLNVKMRPLDLSQQRDMMRVHASEYRVNLNNP
jgi:hypothetical protein